MRRFYEQTRVFFKSFCSRIQTCTTGCYGYDSAHRITQATDTQGNYIQYTPDSLAI